MSAAIARRLRGLGFTDRQSERFLLGIHECQIDGKSLTRATDEQLSKFATYVIEWHHDMDSASACVPSSGRHSQSRVIDDVHLIRGGSPGLKK